MLSKLPVYCPQTFRIKSDQTLGKSERLKSRKIIELLFKEGKSVAVYPMRITYKIIAADTIPDQGSASAESLVIPTRLPGLQAGFGASSRNFKKAVDRNRIKRLLRESYRLQKAEFVKQLSGKNVPALLTTGDIVSGKSITDNITSKSTRGKFAGLAFFIIYTGKELPAYDFVNDKLRLALQKLIDHI